MKITFHIEIHRIEFSNHCISGDYMYEKFSHIQFLKSLYIFSYILVKIKLNYNKLYIGDQRTINTFMNYLYIFNYAVYSFNSYPFLFTDNSVDGIFFHICTPLF